MNLDFLNIEGHTQKPAAEAAPRDFRWPAEWEPQDAVWFTWPHRSDTWPAKKLSSIQKQFADFIALISRTQPVSINVAAPHHSAVLEALKIAHAELDHITLHDHPSNDVWCRDHGATFVVDQSSKQLHGIDWHFNAWGGKFPPWELDDQVAAKMASAISAETTRSSIFLEGGAIEGNGAGVVLTTEAVALNPNRNPELSKQDIEQELQRCLGASSIFWLPSGIEGDDTDGHIDDLTRFVAEDMIVSIEDLNPKSPNYRVLQTNLELLQDLKTASGSNVETIPLPMPDPLRADQWRLDTLPASYANFLILNQLVLVPTFDQSRNDDRACGMLRELFPSREVVGIDCSEILWEGGAIHCLSQQQPSVT
ncbi:agmatine deiminase family protein [Rubritalea marina]|uniref:agmatine deiminase family protein n=1 Tax=Rubritalea marina TaxID=361055 RepID=UPI0003807A4A|nr:agmatine deiminase family protein [Rubritalea marina]